MTEDKNYLGSFKKHSYVSHLLSQNLGMGANLFLKGDVCVCTFYTGTATTSLFNNYLSLLLERGKGGRKTGRETSMCKRNIGGVPLTRTPTKSNRQPFALWYDTQLAEPRWSELEQHAS